MAKRRSPPKDAKVAAPGPLHSPFAGLASLREQLPEGEVASKEVEVAPDADHSASDTISDKVVVRHERKGRKGKTVTRISGLGGDQGDADAWARRLKRDLGCGGSVDAGDILLTGNLIDRTVAWLEAAGVARVVRGS